MEEEPKQFLEAWVTFLGNKKDSLEEQIETEKIQDFLRREAIADEGLIWVSDEDEGVIVFFNDIIFSILVIFKI